MSTNVTTITVLGLENLAEVLDTIWSSGGYEEFCARRMERSPEVRDLARESHPVKAEVPLGTMLGDAAYLAECEGFDPEPLSRLMKKVALTRKMLSEASSLVSQLVRKVVSGDQADVPAMTQ